MLPGLMTETIDALRYVGHWGHALVTKLSLFDHAGRVRFLCATVVLGVFIFATPAAAQIGIEAVEGILCQGEIGSIIASGITLVIGLWSGYFILKFLIRLMVGSTKRGEKMSIIAISRSRFEIASIRSSRRCYPCSSASFWLLLGSRSSRVCCRGCQSDVWP
jgi:Zn-dependent protease with chaperone function